MLKKIALSFALLGFMISGIQAQMSSGKAIRDLKKGVLIVRLKSDIKKMEAMKKRNMNQLVEETKTKRDNENGLWMEAFAREYKFSEVLFTYDTLRRTALESGCENCFLNDNFEIDPNISLKDRPFLMLYWNNSQRVGSEGLMFRDPDFQVMKRPFPYLIKTSSIGELMRRSSDKQVNFERVIRKMNKKLLRFYENRS